MLKCEVHLNDEKIAADGIYTPDELHSRVDEVFNRFELAKGENGFYYGIGSDKDFAHFWCVIFYLGDQNWFMEYVGRWFWYEDDETDDLKSFYIKERAKRLNNYA